MQIVFLTNAWEDYLYWQKYDKKILAKINRLIRECQRTPFDGIGKPEALKNDLSSWWSRRITHEHRLVYRIESDLLYIAQCRKHY